jgi:hypothetical protein
VSGEGGAAGVWDELWLASADLPGMTLRPVFDRVWSGAPNCQARLRVSRGGTEPLVDPGAALLSRPIGEVLAAPV